MIRYHLLLTRGTTMTEVQDDIFIIVRGIWPTTLGDSHRKLKECNAHLCSANWPNTYQLPQSCTATTVLVRQPKDCTAKCQCTSLLGNPSSQGVKRPLDPIPGNWFRGQLKIWFMCYPGAQSHCAQMFCPVWYKSTSRQEGWPIIIRLELKRCYYSEDNLCWEFSYSESETLESHRRETVIRKHSDSMLYCWMGKNLQNKLQLPSHKT